MLLHAGFPAKRHTLSSPPRCRWPHSLTFRLDWHAALYDANARMAAAAAHQQHNRDLASAHEPFWPQHEHQQQHQQQQVPPHHQHHQHQAAAAAAYGSSALAPAALRQALLGGGPRDLALSDKVAAIVVANELGEGAAGVWGAQPCGPRPSKVAPVLLSASTAPARRSVS